MTNITVIAGPSSGLPPVTSSSPSFMSGIAYLQPVTPVLTSSVANPPHPSVGKYTTAI